jgi:hypothetical protein
LLFFFVVVVAAAVDAAGAAVAVDAGAAVAVDAGAAAVVVAAAVPVEAVAPDKPPAADVPNCGGVIAKTAPRLPKVPTPINSPRFAPILLSLFSTRSLILG